MKKISLFEDGFDEAAVRRYVLTGMTSQDAKQLVDEIRSRRESSYDNLDEMEKTIRKWINPAE